VYREDKYVTIGAIQYYRPNYIWEIRKVLYFGLLF